MLAIKLFISHLIWMKLIFCFSIDWIETEIINFFFKAQAADQLKSTASVKSANKRSSSKVKEAWLYRLSLLGNLMPISARFVFLYLGKFYSTCFNQNCFRRHQIQSTSLIHLPQRHHWADITLRLKFTSCLHLCQFLLRVSIVHKSNLI